MPLLPKSPSSLYPYLKRRHFNCQNKSPMPRPIVLRKKENFLLPKGDMLIVFLLISTNLRVNK